MIFMFYILGSVRILNATTGNCAHSDRSLCEDIEGEEEDGKIYISQAQYCKTLDKIVLVTIDHNIIFLNSDFTVHKQVHSSAYIGVL